MRHFRLVALLLLAATAHAADVPFYTENWANRNNWTTQSGWAGNQSSPYPALWGGNLRLVYNGTPPSQDYSVSSGWNAESPYKVRHYLRISGGGHYMIEATWDPGLNTDTVTVYRVDGSTPTALGSGGWYHSGTLKSSIIGSTISVSAGGASSISVTDSTYSSGNPGVGVEDCASTSICYIGQTTLLFPDVTAPSVPTGLTVAALYYDHVNLSWTASTDNSGAAPSYKIYRGGTYIGTSTTTQYTDLTAEYQTTYLYKVSAIDASNNESAQSSQVSATTPAPNLAAPQTGSPVEYASSWGAGPERISLLTGAFSFRLPLAQPKHRGPGPGAGLVASWSSQLWNWDATGSHMTAIDVGYGLGVVFQIGAIWPIFTGETLQRYDFQDGAGVIHQLQNAGTNQWRSQDSTYLLYNDATRTMYFTDGTFWKFDCISRYGEPDSGTRYPTKLTDSNGNVIFITYMEAVGMSSSQTNNSGRIKQIKDSQTVYNWTYATVNGKPHVTTVKHNQPGNGTLHTDAQYTYSTSTTITSPFDSTTITGVTLLASVTFTGSPAAHVFSYNGYGEITKVKFPYGGYFEYEYVLATFSNNARKIREVSARKMCAAPSGSACETGALQTYTFSHPPGDTSLPAHTQTTVADPPGNQKVWDFINGSSAGWDNGLESMMRTYQGTTTVLRTVNTYWTQDDTNSQTIKNPRAWKVVTTLEDGATKSMTQKDVDSNGNATQVREYGFHTGSDPSTPYRTTTTTYLGGTNYTSRNILNRPTQVTVCAGASGCGTPASQVTYSYDSPGIILNSPACQFADTDTRDAAYNPWNFYYRGDVTQVNNNGVITNVSQLDFCGVVRQTKDANNNVLASTTLNNLNQVTSVSGGGNTSSMTYESNGSGLLSAATGSNSDTVSFSYSSTRPTSITNPDGSVSTLSYNDTYPASRTGTTSLGRVSKTVYDGFGRPLKSAVRKSTGPEVWIVTETQYEACSCSTTGKTKKTSRPYLANSSLTATETVYWNTNTYDALGRPTQVTLPDTKYTTYAYGVDSAILATTTTVTEPGGKQKRYFNNAFGQLIRVHEPLVSSTLVESARYTYDVMGRMLQVQMGGTPQGTNPTSFSQTRTFNYNTQGQLTSATNPENGTVNYTYRSDGLLATKTDAKNQTLYYVYDESTKKLAAIQNSVGTSYTTFRYGTASDPAAWKAKGRLVSATNQEVNGVYTSNAYTWWYAYDVMGRVSKQTLVTPQGQAHQAQYTFDNDSRMTQIRYPGTPGNWNAETSQPTDNLNTDGVPYAYTFNTLGQQTSMQMYYNGAWQTQAHGAAYNAAGQLTQWNEGNETDYITPTRSYSATRGWLTNIYSPGQVLLGYSYNDNGRVSAVTDSVNPGQSASYQYDNLNRLTQATTPNWGLSWTYDEFGNRLTQTGTGTATSVSQTLSYSSATNRINGYSYDANGNLLSVSGTGLTYDIFDRVKQAVKGANTYQYAYDAFGRRVAVTTVTETDSWTTLSFYDINGRLLSGGNVYFAGTRLGQRTDRTGNVRYGTGSGWSHYYPYGEEITSTTNDRYKFAETFRDSDTGLDYAMARYYASGAGRFVTPDPSHTNGRPQSPASWNAYSYVLGDPVNFRDASGLYPCDAFPTFVDTPDDYCEKGTPINARPCVSLNLFGFVSLTVCPNGGASSTAPKPNPATVTCTINVFSRNITNTLGLFQHTYLELVQTGGGATDFDWIIEGVPTQPAGLASGGGLDIVTEAAAGAPYVGNTNPATNNNFASFSGTQNTCDDLRRILDAVDNYRRGPGVNYSPLPDGTTTFNSNSTTYTLLNLIPGIPGLPGWGTRLTDYLPGPFTPGWGQTVPGLHP